MDTKDITKSKMYLQEIPTPVGIQYILKVGETSISSDNIDDCKLICEAFNVANETGLSPTQMRDRIKELEGVLTMAKSHISIFNINGKKNPELMQLIETALNNKQK